MKFAFDSGGATNIIKANYPSSNYESELSKPQTSKKDVGDHDRLREERIKIHERTFTAGLIGHQGKKRGRRMTRDT